MMEVKRLGDGLTCIVDPDAPYPNSSRTWLAEGGPVCYVINPGWTGSVDRLPEPFRDRFRAAVKLGTHYHHDSIRQFGALGPHVCVSTRQAQARNCDEAGVGCAPALADGICSPSTWLTLQPIAPFPVAQVFANDDPNIGDPAGAVAALPCDGHSETDQAYLHRPSRTLWTGDIFYIGDLFYFTHGGGLDAALRTLASFVARDDWDYAAQPHWDYAVRPDPKGQDFLVPRSAVAQLLEDLDAVKRGRVRGTLTPIGWWSAPAYVYPVSSGTVAIADPGHARSS